MALNDQPYDSNPINQGGSSTGSETAHDDRPADYQTHQLVDAPYTLDYEVASLQPDDHVEDSPAVQATSTAFPQRTTSRRAPPGSQKLSVMNPETFEQSFDPLVERNEDDTPTATLTSATNSNNIHSLTDPSPIHSLQPSESDFNPPNLTSPYDNTANPFNDLPELHGAGESIDLPMNTADVPAPLNPRRSTPESVPDQPHEPEFSSSPDVRPVSYHRGGRTTLPSQQARYSSYGSLTPAVSASPPERSGGGGLRVMNADNSDDDDDTPAGSPSRNPHAPPAPSSSTNIYDASSDHELEEEWPQEALLYNEDPAVRARILRERMGSTRKQADPAPSGNRSTSNGYGNALHAEDAYTRDGNRERGTSITQSDVSSVAGSVRRRYDGSDW